MVSEESPLLASTARVEAIYDRFAPHQKRQIVFIVSVAGFLPMFVSATLVPAIPQIAKDLNSTHAVVRCVICSSDVTFGDGAISQLGFQSVDLGNCCWIVGLGYVFLFLPTDGRRPIYLWRMPFLCAGSCGVATSTSLRSLLFWRFVQTFGCSGGIPLGAGVIGDIYKLEERGTVIGAFFGATLFGFAIAPFLGGAAAQYWSWRNLHYCLSAWGLLEFLLILNLFPETSHPGTLGIDKIQRRRWIHVAWVNPLSCLWLLRSPNLFAVMLTSTLVLLTDYVLLVPLAYTIVSWQSSSDRILIAVQGIRYGITNEAIIGACFLPNGLGNFIGAPIAGRLSDVVVKRWQEKRKGVWFPEDRLRATWIGGLIMVPLSIGTSGLITTYVGGRIGLSLNLLCLFLNGMGVDFVLNPIGSYHVDVAHSRSAEVIAASAAIRSIILSTATALVIPSVEHIGVAWTNIIATVLALIGQGIIFLTIRYGDRMRASVDVGFSNSN
ncbi:major facilitator superfamily domain-containing protein [Suillus clintonianus]|uniref:major facilitator superfamily domain-containing protein n=1 Tax=Suillus clintonianus TaxID=1904413 RepID=UPI001B86AA51|nr:major facilitator superfamily domain-containing protein [Suillus clintonianus]KAG2148786.1 major facilitator superfamily domain-containing protein [Suillus clintonianus]